MRAVSCPEDRARPLARSRARRGDGPLPGLDQSATHQTGRPAAGRIGMAERAQIRRATGCMPGLGPGWRFRLLTRTGLDWTRKYPGHRRRRSRLLLPGQGGLPRRGSCAAFSPRWHHPPSALIQECIGQPANSDALVFFPVRSPPTLDGEAIQRALPLSDRKERFLSATYFRARVRRLQLHSDHQIGRGTGPSTTAPCALESGKGIVSKRGRMRPTRPGNRGPVA